MESMEVWTRDQTWRQGGKYISILIASKVLFRNLPRFKSFVFNVERVFFVCTLIFLETQ